MAPSPVSPPVPAPMAQPIAPPVQTAMRKATLLEAIAAARAAFGPLKKDTTNTYLRSEYLALPGLLAAIMPPLLEQGCTVYSQIIYSEAGWVVRTTIAFVDGTEEISSDFPIVDLSNQQRIGAIVTYGTRYNLFAMLPVCPENADDDGNSGSYSAAPVATAPLAGLPGLPGVMPAPAGWPMPGQHVEAAPAMYQQAAPVPAPIAYPAQPLPVLQ